MENNMCPMKKQQGFTLLIVLVALLVLGGIVITATDITGSKQREASSQVTKASLDAAIYAGYNYTKRLLEEVDGNSTSRSLLCDASQNLLTNKASDEKVFLNHTNSSQKISWKIVDIEKNCASQNNAFSYKIKAWQGIEAKPINIAYAKARLDIDIDVGKGPAGALKGTLGDRAVTTGGELSLKGNARVEGSTLSDELNFTGSSRIDAIDLEGYSNKSEYNTIKHDGKIGLPSWYNGFGAGMEQIDRTQEEELEELPDDPLGLMNELNNMYYTEPSGKKRDLEWLKKKTPTFGTAGGLTTNVFLTPTSMERRGKLLGLKRPIETTKFFKPVTFFEQDVSMGFTRGLALSSNNGLTVSGGDVYLYIDGNLTFGGGSSLDIEPDSSLTIVVTGDVNIYGGFIYKFDSSFNTKGEPIFSILATNERRSWSDVFGYESVRLRNSAKHRGLIYSLSDVRLTGDAEIKGQLYAENVSIENSSRIIYEKAKIPGGSSESNGGSSGTATTYSLEFKGIRFLD